MSGLCIAYGTVLLTSSDTRGKLVAEFNSAVADWESTHRPSFLEAGAGGVDVIGFPDVTAPRPIRLLPAFGGDEILDQGSDIHTYSRLRYESQGWAPFGSEDGTRTWRELVSSPVVRAGGGESKSVALSPFPITKVDASPASIEKVCASTGGSMFTSAHECRHYRRIKEVCFVGVFGTHGWVPDSRSCTDQDSAVSRWETEGLGRVNPVLPPLNLTAVRIILRSPADPFFVARNLTDGTLDFGATLRQKHALGLCLVIVGGIGVGCILLVGAFSLGPSCFSPKVRRPEVNYTGVAGVLPPADGEWQDAVEANRAEDGPQQSSGVEV